MAGSQKASNASTRSATIYCMMDLAFHGLGTVAPFIRFSWPNKPRRHLLRHVWLSTTSPFFRSSNSPSRVTMRPQLAQLLRRVRATLYLLVGTALRHSRRFEPPAARLPIPPAPPDAMQIQLCSGRHHLSHM